MLMIVSDHQGIDTIRQKLKLISPWKYYRADEIF